MRIYGFLAAILGVQHRAVAKGGRPPPAKTECPPAGFGTVGLTVTQWASKKQFVNRFWILILLKINLWP